MRDRNVLYGFAFIALIGVVIAGTVALYKGVFRSSVPLTVEANRAGMTLTSGAPVKLRGVVVGQVGSVTDIGGIRGDAVRIKLQIDPSMRHDIPADVTAEIVPPTAFGAKYVQLDPGTSTTPAIAVGSTIHADKVTVEVDQAFENLANVLQAAQPAEVDAALTAGAEAVNQRGQELGQLITATNNYLTSFNPFITTLTTDIKSGQSVAATYASVRPALVALASQAGVTSRTLTSQQASLQAFALSLTSFDSQTSTLLNSSGRQLTATFKLLGPVASVVAKYSPELPCTILGLASANTLAEAAVGGTHPGVTTFTRLVPSRAPYTYPDNLPQIGDTSGPSCYGLPYVTPAEAQEPATEFDSGANPYVGPQPSPTSGELSSLFGILTNGSNPLAGE